MKKTLLLSVVASTMIIASDWDFNGKAVAFTQTSDQHGGGSLFDSLSTYTGVGLQLKALNKDLYAGIGVGVEVSAIHSDENQVGGFYGGGGNAGTTSAGISQAYLTYGIDNTMLTLGRQTLPKALSPLAFTAGWQTIPNTFDAALLVNKDVQDTTLAYSFIKNTNISVNNYLAESSFEPVNGSDGLHMIAAKNKSIDGLTLTGTYYTGADTTSTLWVDAEFKTANFSIALQGGQKDPDDGDAGTAFGAKVEYNFGIVDTSVAYTTVSDNGQNFTNTGAVEVPLYTETFLNTVGSYAAGPGSNFVKLGASTSVLDGTMIALYGIGTNDSVDETIKKGDYTEFNLIYIKSLTKKLQVFAAYGYSDDDMYTEATAEGSRPSANNFVRLWSRYSF